MYYHYAITILLIVTSCHARLATTKIIPSQPPRLQITFDTPHEQRVYLTHQTLINQVAFNIAQGRPLHATFQELQEILFAEMCLEAIRHMQNANQPLSRIRQFSHIFTSMPEGRFYNHAQCIWHIIQQERPTLDAINQQKNRLQSILTNAIDTHFTH
jgi:hypothetical protein